MNVWDCLTHENFKGSWEVQYEPLVDPVFDAWLKAQEDTFDTNKDTNESR